MTNEQTYQLLVDRADGLLTQEQFRSSEALIAADEEAAEDWKSIQFTINNLREAGVYQRVSAIRASYENKAETASPTTGKVRSLSFTAKLMRIAAVVVVVLASATIIKYVSVSSSGVYNKYYETYELNTVRSSASLEKMEALYREKNWNELLKVAATISNKSNKESFLAGVAYMETKNYEAAAGEFKTILAKASANTDEQFHDEAEFYLALAYLANGSEEQALPIFRSIKSDKQHQYHTRVNNMNLDLRILDMK